MSHNNNCSFWPPSKAQERLDAGFDEGQLSEDGTLIVGDKGDQETFDTGAVRPSYAMATKFDGFPNLTPDLTREFLAILATSMNGSDGWRYEEPRP